MAKVVRGRISGLFGMDTYTADELHAWARRFETHARYEYLVWPDDPAWLLRWAARLRCLAEQKEKAREH